MQFMRRVSVVLLVVALSTTLAMAGPWKVLGTCKANRLTDRDTIHVGADKGTFRKIKFKVFKSGVDFHDVNVHFANGEVFDVKMKEFIRAGGETRVIDLPGGARTIEKVVFWYDTDGKKRGKGKVRLLGRR